MLTEIKNNFNSGGIASYSAEKSVDGNIDKNSLTTEKDKLEISEFAKGLAQIPFDLTGSNVFFDKDSLNFNLNYSDESIFNLSATGYYSLKKRQVNSNFSFTFQKEIIEQGIKTTKKYEVNYQMSYSIQEEKSADKTKTKENIIDFVKRIVERVVEITKDDKQIIKGILFDEEDLKELLAYGDDDKSKSSLKELLYMIFSFAQLKEMMNKNKDAEKILYTPKRIQEEMIKIQKSKTEDIEMNLSIKEIVDEKQEEAKE